jgi:hypothetical protein
VRRLVQLCIPCEKNRGMLPLLVEDLRTKVQVWGGGEALDWKLSTDPQPPVPLTLQAALSTSVRPGGWTKSPFLC